MKNIEFKVYTNLDDLKNIVSRLDEELIILSDYLEDLRNFKLKIEVEPKGSNKNEWINKNKLWRKQR